MNSRPAFDRWDWLTAGIVFLLSATLYFLTAAPNVTLLDSGEFLVAAEHFGVPHPTGYPLWTLTAWLFQLLPLGNPAWEVALWSGLCTAIAVGVASLISSSVVRWTGVFSDDRRGTLARCLVTASICLMLACSESVWSQAVIAEVYGLHSMMVAIFLLSLYLWVLKPYQDRWMFAAFFVLSLAFSNHHLTLTLAPLPFLLILLLRRRAFLDWLLAALLTVLLGFLIFAILSKELPVLKTALRLCFCIMLAAAVYIAHRKFRIRWRLVAYLPIVVFAGLAPYLYMPFASSTNPPMNWAYAREADGFFFSFNRSQYSGKLTEVSLKTIGRLVGTAPPPKTKDEKRFDDMLSPKGGNSLQRWSGFYWGQIMRAFTPFAVIGYFVSLIAVLRLPLAQRTWIYFLHIAFVLSGFLQPFMDKAEIDNTGWWLNMPFRGYSNLIFAILCVFGTAWCISRLMRRRALYFWLAPLCFLGVPYTYIGSRDTSTQRDRWFGWMFGHDMLKDLPKDSIIVGGTDPGRFVPTYMIFGESFLDPKLKRDPSFDRRDLYILTQMGFGESNYTKYLRDQYTEERPLPKNAFERWLGREHAYPKEPLILPSEAENKSIILQAAAKQGGMDRLFEDDPSAAFSAIFKWIWEKNVDKHAIFVEESIPMQWTYDYATPHGLIYQVEKEPTGQLSPEIVARDFAFWKDYKTKLLSNPDYLKDYDAKRSFSKLRSTIGNIYFHKKMYAEAEAAYRESLELFPGFGEATLGLCRIYWEKDDYDTPISLWNETLLLDFDNVTFWRYRIGAERRKKAYTDARELQSKLAKDPKNREFFIQLLKLYTELNKEEKANEIAESSLQALPHDTDMLKALVDYYSQTDQIEKALEPAQRLVAKEGSNPQILLSLARIHFSRGEKKEFYEAVEQAIKAGGEPIKQLILEDPVFNNWAQDPEFQKLRMPEVGKPAELQPAATSSTGRQEQKTLRSP